MDRIEVNQTTNEKQALRETQLICPCGSEELRVVERDLLMGSENDFRLGQHPSGEPLLMVKVIREKNIQLICSQCGRVAENWSEQPWREWATVSYLEVFGLEGNRKQRLELLIDRAFGWKWSEPTIVLDEMPEGLSWPKPRPTYIPGVD